MLIGRRTTFALFGASLLAPATALARAQDPDALWAAIKKRGTLKIGTEGTYPPFSFETESQKLTGYDVDFARALCKEISLKPDFMLMPWDSILASLETQRIDVGINQATITAARKKKYAFSIPYTVSGIQIIVRKGTQGIDGPQSLSGKRVGVGLGTNYEEWLKSHVPGAQVVTYAGGSPPMLQDLRVGRIEAAIQDRLMIAYTIKHSGAPFVRAGEPFAKQESAVVMAKDNSVLLAHINAGIKKLEADGTLKAISDKWFGIDVS